MLLATRAGTRVAVRAGDTGARHPVGAESRATLATDRRPGCKLRPPLVLATSPKDSSVRTPRRRAHPRQRARQPAGTAIVHAAQHIYCTGWTEIGIQHPQADKGHAVPEVLELTDLRGSTVIACGDHLNDLGMFAVADESIAPANAHAMVLAAATSAVASNDEDGVIRWLLSRVGLTGAAYYAGARPGLTHGPPPGQEEVQGDSRGAGQASAATDPLSRTIRYVTAPHRL